MALISVPIREIHEIELSSRCSLACRYCPHPKLERPKEDMAWETFERTLVHVAYYVQKGTQTEVSLTGIGEAILHPRFVEAVFRVRELIGGRQITLATNGVDMTPELAEVLARLRVVTYVSTHRPEKAGPAWQMLKDAGAITGLNTAFVDSSIDWAGQTKWHVAAKSHECTYLAVGWGVVRQDGSVNACCMDAHGKHRLGTVFDEPGTLMTRPIGLCSACHLTVPKHMQEGVAA
jgi:hypothetical protein